MAIAIGVILGLVQFFLLSRFVTSVTQGGLSARAILFGLFVFFFAPVALLGAAFLFSDRLHLVAIGMVSSLIVSAFIAFIFHGRRKSKGSD